MEMSGNLPGMGHVPTQNAGKIVKVRWVKRYPEATTQVCVGELVRETPEYLVVKGVVLNFKDGAQVRRDDERVRWIPWVQIAAVTELPMDMKWRKTEFYVDENGQVQYR